MASQVEIDYLVIGHVTRDLLDGQEATTGGTASYSSRTASRLGCRTAVVTSTGDDLDLERALGRSILVARQPASETTTMENRYERGERRQVVHSAATLLTADDVPLTWQASIIHVGPIARECDISLVDIVGKAFLGVTPQGLMRGWDEQGYVSYREWENAEAWLARADAVVLSDEDLDGHQELVARYAAQTQVLIVTHGPGGCTVHTNGRQKRFRAPEATHPLDPTGAGDIFAAAFFILFHRTRHLEQAARFANCIAAGSVARRGLAGIPTDEEIAHCTAILGD